MPSQPSPQPQTSPRSHRRPRPSRSPRIDATVLGAASILALAMGGGAASEASGPVGATVPPSAVDVATPVDLAGGWASADGAVQLNLGADGRYERSITGRKKVTHGTYRIDALSLYLRDESGLRTTVKIYDGALDMAGHELHRS